jgi:hypothetical protein
MGEAVGDGRVLAGGIACPVVAGSAVMEFSSAVNGVWRQGCERCSLLSAHASLLLLTRARPLAWRQGLRFAGGAAMVGAGRILRTMVSFSRPSSTSYDTLAQPSLSTHSWYKSRRREVTERGGEVAYRLQAAWRSGSGRSVAACTHQWGCHRHPFSP